MLLPISLSVMRGLPVRYDEQLVRQITSGIFNRDIPPRVAGDIEGDIGITEYEATATIAATILMDTGFEDSHVMAILRFFRADFVKIAMDWRAQAAAEFTPTFKQAILSLGDNQYAVILPYGEALQQGDAFNFREATIQHGAKAPLLEASVNLTRAFELALGTSLKSRYYHGLVAASAPAE